MHFKDFSRMNLARCQSPKGFNHALSSWSMSDWFLATLGEFGEAANVAKKLNRVRDGIPGNKGVTEAELRRKLKMEIGDAQIYLDLLAQSQGIDLEDAALEAFCAKSAEIGYVPQQSDVAKSSLPQWISPDDVEAAKNVIGECPGEILQMVAILVNLDISTRDHANDLAADGFIFRLEEATDRADLYRESINALVQIWGAPEDDDTAG